MEKDFKYIVNSTKEQATIRIYARIGNAIDEKGNTLSGVIGSDFANEMAWLNDYVKPDLINIRINSSGGNVLDAFAIYSSIINSKAPVIAHIDGLAASAAAVIAVSATKTKMLDGGLFMIHNVMDMSKTADKKVVDAFNESIATLLTNRTGKSKEDIVKLMSEETWYNAEQALENGMIDEIVSDKKKMKAPKLTNITQIESFYNQILNTKTNKMEKNTIAIANSLGLDANAEEATIVNEIKSKTDKITALENKVKSLEDAAAKVAEDAKNALKAKAEKLVNDALEAKKIKEDEKAEMIENASVSESGFAFVEKMLSKISNVVPAEVAFDVSKTQNAAGEVENRAAWTYDKWDKEDGAGLLKIKNENPELYKKLYKTEFGVEPKY